MVRPAGKRNMRLARRASLAVMLRIGMSGVIFMIRALAIVLAFVLGSCSDERGPLSGTFDSYPSSTNAALDAEAIMRGIEQAKAEAALRAARAQKIQISPRSEK